VLIHNSHEVIVVSSPDSAVPELESMGVEFVSIRIDRRGKNPFLDLLILLRMLYIFIRKRPDVFLGFTIKPNLYGGLICRLVKVPHIHNISGMGSVFLNENQLTMFVRFLYRMALRKSHCIFFQNDENLQYFRTHRLFSKEKVERVTGSGIDIIKFSPKPNQPFRNEPIRFLMAGRLIKEKGVKEFVEAAVKLRTEGVGAEFTLMGSLDDTYGTSSVTDKDLKNWDHSSIVEHVGFHEDVRDIINSHDCLVLPSYYSEGVPRILLEAAGMGKPIITTDMPGCRDAVLDGITGYLCKPRDVDDLVSKMKKVIDVDIDDFVLMGQEARKNAVKEFDEKSIIEKYLNCLSEI